MAKRTLLKITASYITFFVLVFKVTKLSITAMVMAVLVKLADICGVHCEEIYSETGLLLGSAGTDDLQVERIIEI